MRMTTISFSVEDDIKKSFDKWAKRDKKSKSDVFRDMVKTYEFNESMDNIQQAAAPILKGLGIDTEDQLYEYLESDETYEDRIRHQRLHSGNKKR
jgi:metal-responsive CopG/Arc/MetJ family transcriptional regulator